MRWALLALAFAACAPSLPPARQLPLVGRHIMPAHVFSFGVASPDEAWLYVVTDGGRIDAVETATGNTRWTSAVPGLPVIAVEDGLFAVIGTRLAALSAASGEVVWQSDPIGLFFTNIGELRLSATQLEGDLYYSHPGSGMTAPGDFFAGRVVIDLATGRVRATKPPAFREFYRRERSPLTVAGLRLEVRSDSQITAGRWLKVTLVALDPATGVTRWTHALPSEDIRKAVVAAQ
jgi:outer membrane protein assembly factor BamB